MKVLLLLIPIAMVFVIIAIRLLFWAVKSGQYDDLDTEGRRILFDESDHPAAPKPASPPALPNSPGKE
jgi:cbb3-type cytochrome oxidase maturation protein